MFKLTKRRAFSFLVALALIGVVPLLPWRRDEPGVTWANYCGVRPGMARSEVERLLGGPADNYCTEWTDFGRDPSMPYLPEDGEMWTADDGGIVVAFDSSGRVTARGWIRPKYGTKWSPRRWIRRAELWWRDREE